MSEEVEYGAPAAYQERYVAFVDVLGLARRLDSFVSHHRLGRHIPLINPG